MKIAIVAPSPVPFTRGGAERALSGIEAALNELTLHETEMIKIPVAERNLPEVIAAYEAFAGLDLSHFDRIVCTKYPSWMVDHPDKTLLMFHPLRGLYDTYWTCRQPLEVPDPSDPVFAMLHLMDQSHHRGALDEFFERFTNALAELGPDHPDLVFPGPFARLAVRWLDSIALSPPAVKRYLSLSATVARRAGYFPDGIRPTVVHLPGHLRAAPPADDAGTYLFTASRLDGPKRLDLLVDAMAHVPGDVELRIAGTGPQREALVARAAHDPRIKFLGFTPSDALGGLYANALAVPFVPADEDLGLITLEAFSQATTVVTCTDSGGPTEFVTDGVTGLVAQPDPTSLGRALRRLVEDPDLAARLGAAGRAREEQVTWDSVVDKILGPDRHAAGPRTTGDGGAPGPAGVLTAGLAAIGAPPERDGDRPKIVVLTTFPIGDPRHGGQIRARRLYGSLTASADVEVVALVDAHHPPERQILAPGLTQVVVPRSAAHDAAAQTASAAAGLPVTDLVAGSHLRDSPLYVEALRSTAADATAIVLAEPYLHPAIALAGIELPVIYDAYNVEATLKAAAYPDTPEGRELLAQVVAVEAAAVSDASHVTCCSDEDADELARRYDRDRADITSIPNGTVIPASVPTPAERAERSARWRERFWRAGSTGPRPEHLAVFFGSWHPPNIDAAELLCEIAPELPHVLFLSVGFHGEAFANRRLPENLIFPGQVGQAAKDEILAAADVALNPMRSGSGTNLKLVEYVAVGLPVLSTPFGARGTDLIDGRHLVVAPPERFATALGEILTDPEAAARRAAAGRALVTEHYGWDALGRRLAGVVSDLVPTQARE